MKYSLLRITADFIEVLLPHCWGISTGMVDILSSCSAAGVKLVPWIWQESIGIGGMKDGAAVELTFQRVKYLCIGIFYDDSEKALLFVAAKQMINLIEGRK